MQSVKNLVGANHGVEFNALHKEVSCISAQLDKLQEVSLTPLADTKTAFDHGDFREATALTAHQLSGQQHEQHEQQEEYSFDFEQTYGL